jgi:hypothetical protein
MGTAHDPFEHAPAIFSVAVPPAQLAGEQIVLSAYFWQPPAPSHLPFVPQVVGPWSVQNVTGAAVPATTGAHAPVPETLQAWQAGQLALPQQTPSTQLPLMHWPPDAHASPFALSAQLRVLPEP